MGKIKTISERVSYKDHDDCTTIVISPKIDRWKETILTVWIVAWTFCGAFFLFEFFTVEHDKETSLALIIMLSFWVYFEYKIGKAVLWRKYGAEYFRIEDNQLFYKRSIMNYGKAKIFFCDNIKQIIKVDRSNLSPFSFLEKSAWYIGGETLQFTHKDKVVPFAMQLSDQETAKLLDTFKRKIKQHS